MPVNLSIKDVPDEVAERLRRRAASNHRSLQGELLSIVAQAAAQAPAEAASAPLPGIRRSWTQGSKTFDRLVAEREAAGWKPDPTLARAPLGVDIIPADRDSR